MHALRRSRTLARLVLLWFGLFIGAAIMGPLVRPVAWQAVCSGRGLQLVASTPQAADAFPASGVSHVPDPPHRHALDCPLCLTFSAPPPPLTSWAPAHWPTPSARLGKPLQRPRVQAAAPPLPSRGPPSLLA